MRRVTVRWNELLVGYIHWVTKIVNVRACDHLLVTVYWHKSKAATEKNKL